MIEVLAFESWECCGRGSLSDSRCQCDIKQMTLRPRCPGKKSSDFWALRAGFLSEFEIEGNLCSRVEVVKRFEFVCVLNSAGKRHFAL